MSRHHIFSQISKIFPFAPQEFHRFPTLNTRQAHPGTHHFHDFPHDFSPQMFGHPNDRPPQYWSINPKTNVVVTVVGDSSKSINKPQGFPQLHHLRNRISDGLFTVESDREEVVTGWGLERERLGVVLLGFQASNMSFVTSYGVINPHYYNHPWQEYWTGLWLFLLNDFGGQEKVVLDAPLFQSFGNKKRCF